MDKQCENKRIKESLTLLEIREGPRANPEGRGGAGVEGCLKRLVSYAEALAHSSAGCSVDGLG